ncbi:MAG: twin-arginine translocation signal domain-containing protein [Candidatus Hydrogenedentes bacterium]|nr:twin-arginine translocation signal domain-containing protein [Candidatus Hydrogenedentota bacterium]
MRLSRRQFLVGAAAAAAWGCRTTSTAVVSPSLVWGRPGMQNGAFRRPRGIGVKEREVFVIDRTGRIQVFTEDGAFLRSWSTPASDNGTPTSISFDRSGNVLVPDTHYSHILEYSPQGEMLRHWGAYGTGPEQFIYPTSIVQVPDGTYYISEYGLEAERVHVFDTERRFARQWGEQGAGPGHFSRAMAIDFRDDKVYVADTGNHRIQYFDLQGEFRGIIGGAGTDPGRLSYPYDMCVGPQGYVFACEYGNNRVSIFAADGTIVACFGRAGRKPGEFGGPRGIAVSDRGSVFVADTENDRVQRFELERLT